jgi:hypothetical protein
MNQTAQSVLPELRQAVVDRAVKWRQYMPHRAPAKSKRESGIYS